jgi:hypothetical protein
LATAVGISTPRRAVAGAADDGGRDAAVERLFREH